MTKALIFIVLVVIQRTKISIQGGKQRLPPPCLEYMGHATKYVLHMKRYTQNESFETKIMIFPYLVGM